MAKKKKKASKKVSEKKRITALFLCMFFGWAGFHRFYVNKFPTGVLMMFTMGGFGIMNMVDFFMIIFGNFKDAYGKSVTNWV
jgi:TM2 domain-containing membrane protein YozV